jgi:hypothetical protein
MKIIIFTVALPIFAGCGTIRTETQTVKVPVPVKCQQVEPVRPTMPTESLSVSDSEDTKVASALAEIDIREGYEGQLRTALRACL